MLTPKNAFLVYTCLSLSWAVRPEQKAKAVIIEGLSPSRAGSVHYQQPLNRTGRWFGATLAPLPTRAAKTAAEKEAVLPKLPESQESEHKTVGTTAATVIAAPPAVPQAKGLLPADSNLHPEWTHDLGYIALVLALLIILWIICVGGWALVILPLCHATPTKKVVADESHFTL